MKAERPLYIFLIVAASYLIAGWWLSENIILHGNESIDRRYKVAEILNFEKRLLSAEEWISITDEWDEKKERSEALLLESDRQYEKAVDSTYHLVMVSIAFALIAFLAFFGSRQFLKVCSLTLVVLSTVFLYVGIFSPIMELSAFHVDLKIPLELSMQDVPLVSDVPWVGDQVFDMSKTFEGRIYYFYQSKTIMQLIGLLFKGGNTLVGIAILAFSVVIPLLKLLMTVAVVFMGRLQRIKWMTDLIGWIGKYSMADVFVVAAYLAYFSYKNMNTGVQTEANTMMGLYFFFAYVVLSILSTILMKRILKQPAVDDRVRIGATNWK